MLKMVLKLLFSLAALFMMGLMYLDTSQDLKVVLGFFASLGATLLAAIDLYDKFCSDKKNYEEKFKSEEKELRDIFYDFVNNYFHSLHTLKIFTSKSEVSYESVYQISQDQHIHTLLNDNQYYPMLDALERYAVLYEKNR